MRAHAPIPPIARALAGLAALTALTALAGCGDTTTDEAAGCEPGAGETVTVEIGDFVFDPTPVEIAPCDSVVWTNVHSQPHTSTGQGEQAWSTGNLQEGDASEPVRFEAAGDFTYICALHPFMEGSVQVSS